MHTIKAELLHNLLNSKLLDKLNKNEGDEKEVNDWLHFAFMDPALIARNFQGCICILVQMPSLLFIRTLTLIDISNRAINMKCSH